jgi:hypothetical protein
MNAPPALPASPTPSPGRPPGDAARGFVSGLAWISIAMGALGVGSGLLELLAAQASTAEGVQQLLGALGGGALALPPMLRWTLEHSVEISLVSIVLSALMLWLGWGVLRRREWARVGFIFFLAVGALLPFGLAWLLPALVASTLSAQLGLQPQQLPPELAGMKTAMAAFGTIVALVLAALHGAIIRTLCTPAVRGQFAAAGSAPRSD